MDTEIVPLTLPIYRGFIEKLLREDSASGRMVRSAVTCKGIDAVMNPQWVQVRQDYTEPLAISPHPAPTVVARPI